MEDMNYPNDDEMMVEGTSANQDPDDCGEFTTFGGDIGRYGGGTEHRWKKLRITRTLFLDFF